MTQNQESRSMMSYEESVAFNEGWNRGEAYGRRTERGHMEPLKTEVVSLRAERDALRAQLDGMTVERSTRIRYDASIASDVHTEVQRLIGPWVEVE